MPLKLNCRETSRLLSQAQDRRLSLFERATLRMHLGVCDACTRFSRQLEFLRAAMRAYPRPDTAKEKSTR
jgi:hypothetical protein